MVLIMSVIFWISFWALFVVWLAYPIGLFVLTNCASLRNRRHNISPNTSTPLLSIVIAAHNEEDVMEARLKNILNTAPQNFDFEIIVMSDHSTDRTVEVTRIASQSEPRIRVYQTVGERGKAVAHNQAHPKCKGEIIVFTDAETEFADGFLELIGHAFDDPEVGFASGKLIWRNKNGGATGENFSLYWRFEVWLREMESHLGIHALGTGACSAVRKRLFLPIPPEGDEDFITPIDVVKQGYLTIFVPDAIAFDYVAESPLGEFNSRIRMTSKNFLGTINRWGRDGLVNRPTHSISLVLHKLGRWLTPYFGLGLLLSGTVIMYRSGLSALPAVIGILGWCFVMMSLVGALRPNLPIFGSLWSFLLANTAFALGVLKAFGKKVPTYFDKI